MTILISLFGFAGRFAGDLLSSALGWASSLLFGRVPQAHQRYLVLMMAGSFLWLIVILSLLLPSIGSFLLAATPHPPFIDNQWLGFVLLIAAIALPLGIGLAGALVPSEGKRETGVAMLGEFLRGYLLAPLISGLLIWLAIIGISRKIRSKRQGWSDAHVPIVVEPGGYEQLAADVQAAVESADLAVAVHDAPRALTVPAWLLTKFASDNVRKLRPDRLLELTGRHLRIGIFPSDVAISGPDGSRRRARAAIISRLTTAAVHLTISAEAQGVEDQLRRVAMANASGAAAKAAFARIDASLLELPIQTDEWDLLYRLRLQVERDLLIGAEPGTAFPGHEMTARNRGTGAPAPVPASARAGEAAKPLSREGEEASKNLVPGRDEAPRSATASS